MAPSAETQSSFVQPPFHKNKSKASSGSFASLCNRKTVASAVNYETSMVDYFHHHPKLATPSVQTTTTPTCSRTTRLHTRSNSFVENEAPDDNNLRSRSNWNGSSSGSSTTHVTPPERRTSKRESKQRSISLNPISVRYDMEVVPRVQKNSNFYKSLRRSKKAHEAPFFASVIWKPQKRKQWEDCLSELLAVCTSAGLRKYIQVHTGKRGKKPQFIPPLSRDYIRDRIDIDDPLRGVQVRHATQGWLQGFLCWTNFTTWTHFFTWDSLHDLSGVAKCEHVKDEDGSLAQELQALPRTGAPQDSGVIFQSVAEIALVGGLGCGELLLRMAMQEIIASGQYDFVVLQATVGSRTFYERFGFKRVGAICRYGDQGKLPDLDTRFQGYRHWTHANESQKSLDMHGGPSYMMALKIVDYQDRMPSLLEALDHYTVSERPRIVPTCMSPTPKALKRLKRFPSMGNCGTPAPPLPSITSTRKRVFAVAPSTSTTNLIPSPKPPPSKRLRIQSVDTPKTVTPASSPVLGPTASDLIKPPPPGKPLSYAQKQYQSPWLAVPPATAPSNSARRQRKPPRPRSSRKTLNTISPLTPKKNIVAPVKLLPNSSQSQKQVVPFEGVRSIDRTTLCKQKVKSYPRDRVHYYNKVVKLKSNNNKKTATYYFVLHYNERKQILTLCPMTVKGILSGRRQGRSRFQCVLEQTSKNWVKGSIKDYIVVEAFMVMKTPIVAQEAWDILGT